MPNKDRLAIAAAPVTIFFIANLQIKPGSNGHKLRFGFSPNNGLEMNSFLWRDYRQPTSSIFGDSYGQIVYLCRQSGKFFALADKRYQDPIIVLGGGLFASLTAIAINQSNKHAPVYLIDEGRILDQEVITPVFESDVPLELKPFLEPMIVKAWERCFVSQLENVAVYNDRVFLIAPQQIIAELFGGGPTTKIFECAHVSRVTPKSVTLQNGKKLAAGIVLDLREHDCPQINQPQTYNVIESDYVLDVPHGLEHPVMYDTSISRSQNGDRFSQYIPLGDCFLRVVTLAIGRIVAAKPETDLSGPGVGIASVSRRSGTFALTSPQKNSNQTGSSLGDLELHCSMRLIEAASLAIGLADDVAKGRFSPTRYCSGRFGEPKSMATTVLPN
ncbi:hypothetical protein [Parasphingorhabdus flavimaris]|uniref:hypothetical protein n=1 Tax=Parasphingorhabdus flavimaris TaxID=266812 RepID=UPI003001B9A2